MLGKECSKFRDLGFLAGLRRHPRARAGDLALQRARMVSIKSYRKEIEHLMLINIKGCHRGYQGQVTSQGGCLDANGGAISKRDFQARGKRAPRRATPELLA